MQQTHPSADSSLLVNINEDVGNELISSAIQAQVTNQEQQ